MLHWKVDWLAALFLHPIWCKVQCCTERLIGWQPFLVFFLHLMRCKVQCCTEKWIGWRPFFCPFLHPMRWKVDRLAATLSVKLTNCSEEAFLLLISYRLGKVVRFFFFSFVSVHFFGGFFFVVVKAIKLQDSTNQLLARNFLEIFVSVLFYNCFISRLFWNIFPCFVVIVPTNLKLECSSCNSDCLEQI